VAVARGIGGADDVDAGDVRVHVARHVHAHHLGPVLCVVQHLLGGHDAGLQDLLPVVDVVDEPVQRRHALAQASLHVAPLLARDHARDQVERDQALGAGAVLVLGAVDREGDADAAEDEFRFLALRLHHVGRLLGQPACVGLVVFSHGAGGGVHFVEWLHRPISCPAGLVATPGPAPGSSGRVCTPTVKVCAPPPRITPRSGVTSP